ncbi:DUF5959 family protein [Streptomyces halstedii]|uniref:DUF5959 family protein n=1 Tax=Streptomyces halstedii TaxID=1944 RepID=UPI00345F187E
MTHEHSTADLIRLSDGDSSFRVHVLGRRGPGVLPMHDLLDAEIFMTSSFICGRLDICLRPAELEEWSHCLAALCAGQDIEWLDQGNGPTIRIVWPEENYDIVTVQIEDASGSGASARIPIAPEGNWLGKQQELFDAVRQNWPSEVLQTGLGAYEWRR